jgi:hypothetical protein
LVKLNSDFFAQCCALAIFYLAKKKFSEIDVKVNQGLPIVYKGSYATFMTDLVMSGCDEGHVIRMNGQGVQSFPVTPDNEVEFPLQRTFYDAIVGCSNVKMSILFFRKSSET